MAKNINLFLPLARMHGYNWRFGVASVSEIIEDRISVTHQLLRQVQSAIKKHSAM